MATSWVVRTETGSQYLVREDDEGLWWLAGNNVPSHQSQSLAGEWAIKRPTPWPAVIGESLLMASRYFEQPGHVLRMPGGGKVTSPVVDVWPVDLSEEESTVDIGSGAAHD